MSIIEFLNARLDEDEEMHSYAYTSWHTVECGTDQGYWALERCTCPGPARQLAEVAAKRALIEMHKPMGVTFINGVKISPYCHECQLSPEHILGTFPCNTAKALAAIYKDHPDYDQSWSL